ncbi:hypothetical protein [Butyrivibrio sp. YAB3001]|uniref:hypothetical protein n=1 Tax=Butyrivibrio sp. YAB3001 TaxID=1520812 RepID=UPI0008F6537B|nr:hypothetical protein [Butyrivibrio sp. YAB3001]SFC76778.1 hypothetical protein SAMN02910398_03092 [Butyrivibrio sp. YAB3001]
MTGKKFFKLSLIVIICSIILISGIVYGTDPFFHYRAPSKSFFYRIYDQRSQNDGITRFFDYDSIITGTSMAENFRTSLFDELMGTKSVKLPYSGATYKELNDNLKVSYKSGHELKYVLRPLDYSQLVMDKDILREDMGEYPTWLTNNNPFDDVKYLLNRDVLINYTFPMIAKFFLGKEGGYTDFDDYSYTGDSNSYSKAAALSFLQGSSSFPEADIVYGPSDEDAKKVTGNVVQNVVSLAKEHPETTFLYFFPPYSMAYWGSLKSEGTLDQMLAYKKIAIDQMLECDNIHIYSFSLFTDITENLDNYRDVAHYSPKINEWIMVKIAECEHSAGIDNAFTSDNAVNEQYGRITKENASEYLRLEKELLDNYEYNSLLE